MLKYKPTHIKYAGDANMRLAKQKNQSARNKSKYVERVKRGILLEEDLQLSNFEKKSNYRQGANSRLCGNLIQLDMHLNSSETLNKHGNAWKVYDNVAYSKWYICGVYLNLMSNRGKSAGRTCFFDYHNNTFFGLSREDVGFSKTKSKDWNYPSIAKNIEILGIK